MKKIVLTISLILTITTFNVFAQTEVTTNNGEKVILNKDGTWKYAEQNKVESTTNFDCSELISTNFDKVTGKTLIHSKIFLVISTDEGETGFEIFIGKIKHSGFFSLSIRVYGASSCIDNDNMMSILFRDGTRRSFENDGDSNCDNQFEIFPNFFDEDSKTELEIFRTKEIETMRIQTCDGSVEEDFSVSESNQFLQTLNCLMDN